MHSPFTALSDYWQTERVYFVFCCICIAPLSCAARAVGSIEFAHLHQSAHFWLILSLSLFPPSFRSIHRTESVICFAIAVTMTLETLCVWLTLPHCVFNWFFLVCRHAGNFFIFFFFSSFLLLSACLTDYCRHFLFDAAVPCYWIFTLGKRGESRRRHHLPSPLLLSVCFHSIYSHTHRGIIMCRLICIWLQLPTIVFVCVCMYLFAKRRLPARLGNAMPNSNITQQPFCSLSLSFFLATSNDDFVGQLDSSSGIVLMTCFRIYEIFSFYKEAKDWRSSGHLYIVAQRGFRLPLNSCITHIFRFSFFGRFSLQQHFIEYEYASLEQ